MTVRVPSDATLRAYGLTDKEWLAILRRQGGVCAICKTTPASGRLVTDHEHVAGWPKLPPTERKKYVRGILCTWCNYQILGRTATTFKLANATAYLRSYDRRRARSDRLASP